MDRFYNYVYAGDIIQEDRLDEDGLPVKYLFAIKWDAKGKLWQQVRGVCC